MRRLKSTALIGMMLGAWLITAPQAAKGADLAARAPRDLVQFSPPTFVDPPKVLLGDAGDGRCPTPSEKCLKDVDDLLFGRTHLLRSDDLVLGFQGGAGLLLTSNSEILETSRQNLVQLGDGSNNYSQPAVVGARLFNTASDVAVMLVLDRNNSLLQWRLDSSTATVASGTVDLPGQPSDTTNYLSVVAGDFTGDGFDEIVVFLKGVVSSAIVGTAVDAQEPSQGLKFGPALDLNVGGDHLRPLKITKAAVLGQPRVFVAGPTSFPPGCPTGDAGLGFESFAIDPQSLALVSAGTFAATIPEGNTACLHTVDMTAGRFTTALHDQLLVTYGTEGGNVKVLPFDLNDQGIAMQQPIYDTGYIIGGGGAFIRSGRFDWSSPVDQAALLISNNFNAPGINTLRILSFGQNFTTQAGTELQAGATTGECVNDMAVGNFDHRDPNPGTPPPATIADPNLQVAIPFSNCDTPSVSAVNIRIFGVDPANQQISHLHDFVIGPGGRVFSSTLAPVDLQGRSLRVGPLEGIVTLNQRSQVTLVLAAPPMHVDAVIPVESTTGQQIPYNITGAPAGFQAGYTFSSSTDTKTEVTTGVTSSWSAKEFVEGKATLGDCEVGDCASIDAKVSAEQTANSSQQSLAGTYGGSSQSLNVTTGFSDLVSFQSETLTIFVYPVIGRTVVCPTDPNGCPLTINVAGPDTLVYNEAQGGTDLPWYQPSWIPGNILSYPGSLAQLQAAAFPNPSDFQQLSQAVTWRTTSGGTANASATWTTGGSSGSTASVQQNLSFDASVSVSGQVGLEGVITVEGSAGVDVGGSEGLSTLTDSSKTLSATQGITFTRTADFDDANYGYDVTPYIFGQQQPPSVVAANPPSANTVATYGALRTGHVVGIPTSGCCGFWQAWYGKAPDVALNQPKHWKIHQQGNDPMDGSCRIFGPSTTVFDCLILGDRLPPALGEPIWLSEFHWMRGLFITGPSGGPQLTTATTGDLLLLQARVYNLSLAALPANAQVHVRFMGMPWDTSQNIPAAPSFQIGEYTLEGAQLAQLPPFNDGTQPNWTLVPQAFDTSGTHCGGQSCDNQDLMFWVVVWIQEDTPQGPRLISELPEHGLTSIPAAGEDFFLPAVGMGVATREEAYSNNLGFYNQVFHIFPQTQAPQAPTPLEGEIGAQLTQVGAAHRRLQRGQSTALAAKVQTGGRDLRGGLEVAFYDGDPRVDGTLIGLQYLPHLYANRTHDFRVLFTPQHCGRRTVYVVAGNGTRHEHTAKLPPIVVAGQECKSGGQR